MNIQKAIKHINKGKFIKKPHWANFYLFIQEGNNNRISVNREGVISDWRPTTEDMTSYDYYVCDKDGNIDYSEQKKGEWEIVFIPNLRKGNKGFTAFVTDIEIEQKDSNGDY
jgi:hypothetical protein